MGQETTVLSRYSHCSATKFINHDRASRLEFRYIRINARYVGRKQYRAHQPTRKHFNATNKPSPVPFHSPLSSICVEPRFSFLLSPSSCTHCRSRPGAGNKSPTRFTVFDHIPSWASSTVEDIRLFSSNCPRRCLLPLLQT
jgi:hypothetical protein